MSGILNDAAWATPEASIAGFLARGRTLARVTEDLRDGRAGQHRLIVGSSGSGKSTLLARVAADLVTDKGLAKQWWGLCLRGTHYGVHATSDVWVEAVLALAEASSFRDPERTRKLVDALATLPIEEEARLRACLALLAKHAGKRRLVLLIDDFDHILERIDGWALRRTLSDAGKAITLVATSSAFAPSTYGTAFLDFFGLVTLDELSFDEAAPLLGASDGRAYAMHALFGGNPRALAAAGQARRSHAASGVDGDLAAVLDALWPACQARVERLAAQAQEVFHAVTREFAPAPASALARTLRMDVTQVSAQLTRLVRDGLVAKVELPGTARTGFQVDDRVLAVVTLAHAGAARKRLFALARSLVHVHAPPPDRAAVVRALRADRPGHEALRTLLAGELPDDAPDYVVDEPLLGLGRAVAELLLIRGDAPLLADFLAHSPFGVALPPWLAVARVKETDARELLAVAPEIRNAASDLLKRLR